MKISKCSYRPILETCGLENIDYQIDSYVGCEHYCYYCYALENVETDWTKEILIHEDITKQLKEELEKISPQKIYIGYKTDPYQPCENEYRQTRKVLEILQEKGFSSSILTKSDLIIRDIDILKEMKNPSVSVSVAFNDNSIRRYFEDNTIDTEMRIEALRKLKENNIRTSALVCPVIPYVTDVTSLVDKLAPYTEEIWIYGLSIENRSNRSWKNIESILDLHFPNMKQEIETVVFSKESPYWNQLREELLKLQEDRKLKLNIKL